MSYILEALKKSDQQRQRGTTPTLQAVQITVAAPKRPLLVYYGLIAAVLLGITIGWLRPWQLEQTPAETEPVAAKSPITIPRQTSPAPAPIEMFGKKTQQFPVSNSIPAVQPVPVVEVTKPGASASTATPSTAALIPEKTMPEKTASQADVAQEQKALPLAELSPQIQQEIPVMAIQFHAYSSNPKERLVSINSIRLREGGSLTPDIKLEQITPDGMIFSYKGYRFQRGVR